MPIPHDTTVMLHTSEHAGPDKIFQRFPGPMWSRLKSLFSWDGAVTVSQMWVKLHACALSFMLTPATRLQEVRKLSPYDETS